MTEKFKTLKIIHLAICGGMLAAYLTVGELSIEKLKIQSIETPEIIYLLLPVAAFFLGNFLFKMTLKQVDPKLKLEDKLVAYQTASLIRLAVLEATGFLLLFVAPKFVVLGIAILLYMIYLHPTEEKMATDFQSLT